MGEVQACDGLWSIPPRARSEISGRDLLQICIAKVHIGVGWSTQSGRLQLHFIIVSYSVWPVSIFKETKLVERTCCQLSFLGILRNEERLSFNYLIKFLISPNKISPHWNSPNSGLFTKQPCRVTTKVSCSCSSFISKVRRSKTKTKNKRLFFYKLEHL